MQLGMRSLQAFQRQVQPISSSCDISVNYTAFPIDSCLLKSYLFHAQDFLRGGEVTYNVQFSTESYRRRKVSPIA